LSLYKIDASNNPQADPGTAYIDPNDISQFIPIKVKKVHLLGLKEG